jgi:integrase
MKIRINNHDGRLRLRWHDGIKPQSLAVGVADTSVGIAQTNIKRGEILRDWEAGHYGHLVKYRPQTIGKNASEIMAAQFEKMQPQPDDLVLPAPMGGAIDDQNFRPRAWKQILVGCSIEYRRHYALRHSAISHALANGANPIAIAEQTGHSLKVLLETYAHVIAKEYLFVTV